MDVQCAHSIQSIASIASTASTAFDVVQFCSLALVNAAQPLARYTVHGSRFTIRRRLSRCVDASSPVNLAASLTNAG
ncbi:hypothetical protein BofuT4_P022320.1 [Botrytis cinerea T4]|uniref:Uncharacterized protein n=1 Tax=Botryotinia fuckeliana (strain T4) TaxID=999810 RepID=G2YGT0_BOTF4|nr:hypothetical protein BofuT4_P022320.1 [Botrytis cinerea T4]